MVAQRYVTRWQGKENNYRADVCQAPAEVYDLLSWEDEAGSSGLSNLAKNALERAAEVDSAFEGSTLEEL